MHTTDITIRALTLDDADAIVDIFNQPRAVWGTMQRPLTSPALRHQFVEKITTDPNSHVLAAEIEGRVVGNLGLQMYGSHPRRKHAASLGMSVHDEFAGRGVGSALVAAAVDLCDNWLNIRRLELEVYVDNQPAVALYKTFGFEIEGTLRDLAFREGTYVDGYAMSRLNRPS